MDETIRAKRREKDFQKSHYIHNWVEIVFLRLSSLYPIIVFLLRLHPEFGTKSFIIYSYGLRLSPDFHFCAIIIIRTVHKSCKGFLQHTITVAKKNEWEAKSDSWRINVSLLMAEMWWSHKWGKKSIQWDCEFKNRFIKRFSLTL